MGSGWGGVWGMGGLWVMLCISCDQFGGCKMLWGLRGYGFSEVWVKGGLTVHYNVD